MRFLLLASALLCASCGRAETQVADFPAQRERMVKEQIVMRGVVEERVLAAMRKVAAGRIRAGRISGGELHGSTAADRLRSNHFAALHRRIHDRGIAAAAD